MSNKPQTTEDVTADAIINGVAKDIVKSSACKRCGKCCSLEVCEIGRLCGISADNLPCPMLVKDLQGIKSCGVVLMERVIFKEAGIIAQSLGIGMGCDSDFVEDDKD